MQSALPGRVPGPPPPAYRPSVPPAAKPIQPKLQSALPGRVPGPPPPVYRPSLPTAAKPIQPKLQSALPGRVPGAPPPVYRPQSAPNALLPKSGPFPIARRPGAAPPLSSWRSGARSIQRSQSAAAATALEFEDLPGDVNISARLDLDDEDRPLELLQVKGSNITCQDQIPAAIAAGKIYYRKSGEAATKVTKDLINSLWDKKYSLLERTGDLDWSRNCADYATGSVAAAVHKGDIGATKRYLAQNYDKAGSLSEPDKDTFTELLTGLDVGEYVATGASHFVKVEVKTKGTLIALSEKDGESGIYSASGTPEKAAAVLCLSFQSSCEFYKKKS
jgi:hypothetical protein